MAHVALCSVALFKERQKRFALLAVCKRTTMSDSFRSLIKKERLERFVLFHEQIALSLTKNERFAWKADEQIPNPGLECWRIFQL